MDNKALRNPSNWSTSRDRDRFKALYIFKADYKELYVARNPEDWDPLKEILALDEEAKNLYHRIETLRAENEKLKEEREGIVLALKALAKLK